MARMHSDGYPVQSYEYFFMADERKTGSSLLTRLFGLAKVSTDKRVAMLYSSFFRPFGVGVLKIYGHTMDSAAIGITGGGVELEGLENKEPTNWEEFSRDLRIANIRVCWPVGPDHLTVLVSFSTDRGHRKNLQQIYSLFPRLLPQYVVTL